jgi:rhodanese-related sulfurtransferase
MTHNNLRIEPNKAKSWVDAGQAIMLDVVTPVSRDRIQREIAGAIRIEPEEFASRYKELLPKNKPIIAYCT